PNRCRGGRRAAGVHGAADRCRRGDDRRAGPRLLSRLRRSWGRVGESSAGARRERKGGRGGDGSAAPDGLAVRAHRERFSWGYCSPPSQPPRPGVALDAIRAGMESIRQFARSWERGIDAVETMLRERGERRAELERLTDELRESRAHLARTSEQL